MSPASLPDTAPGDDWSFLDELCDTSVCSSPHQETETAPTTGNPLPAVSGLATGGAIAAAAPETVPVVGSQVPAALAGLAEVRRATTVEAAHAMHSYVHILRESATAGHTDFDDALKAIPILHKLVEHAEKMEVAKRDAGAGALVNFTIDLSGAGITATSRPSLVAEVVPADTCTEVVASNQVIDLSVLRGQS